MTNWPLPRPCRPFFKTPSSSRRSWHRSPVARRRTELFDHDGACTRIAQRGHWEAWRWWGRPAQGAQGETTAAQAVRKGVVYYARGRCATQIRKRRAAHITGSAYLSLLTSRARTGTLAVVRMVGGWCGRAGSARASAGRAARRALERRVQGVGVGVTTHYKLGVTTHMHTHHTHNPISAIKITFAERRIKNIKKNHLNQRTRSTRVRLKR